MKKLIKWLLAFASIGAVTGLIFAYLKKRHSSAESSEAYDCSEDDDFDLDSDLKPASEREYVSLQNDPDETAEPTDCPSSEETLEEAADTDDNTAE